MYGAYIFIIVWTVVIALNAIYQLYYKEKVKEKVLTVNVKIIAWLLFQANSQAWYGFYPLKEKLLKRYGILVGYEYQHFDAIECYNCNGTGMHYSWEEQMYEDCWSCDNGIYKPETWIGLAKYRLGEYSFHVPTGKIVGEMKPRPNSEIVIEGKIRHKKQKYANDANLLLKLIYRTDAKPKRLYCLPDDKDLSPIDRFINFVFVIKNPYSTSTMYGKFIYQLNALLTQLHLKEDDIPF